MPARSDLVSPVRLARGCWISAELADDLVARCVAAIETSADDTLVSSTTAARLHGLWLPDASPEIHLATSTPQRKAEQMTRTRRKEFRAHRRRLAEGDRTVLRGLPIMSVARTWLDLAADFDLADLVAAGDSALRLGCTVDELRAVIDRCRRVRGRARAQAAVPLLDARSRSRPESHLRVATLAPGLPRFAVNEAVHRAEGGWLAEPDLSLAAAKIALEYQGADHATIERMRKDITRAADLRTEGWACLLYGPTEVFGRAWQIAPERRSLITVRAPHLLGPRRPPR